MAFGALKGTLGRSVASITNPLSAFGAVTVTVGDLVVALLAEQTDLTVTAVTDNLGNSYTAQNAGTDAGTVSGRLFWSRVTVAGQLTSVSATTTGSTNDAVFPCAVFQGPFASSPVDANPANNNNTDSTSPYTCPATGTLAQADELVVCWMVGDTSNTWSATSPLLKATQSNQSTNINAIIGYKTVSDTTTTSPEFTGTDPATSIQGTVSFKKDLTVLALDDRAGGDPVDAELRRPFFKSAAMVATGLFFVAMPPSALVTPVADRFEPKLPVVRTVKTQPSALRGESLFGVFSPWKNMGFEVQPWQPPHRAAEKKHGALARGHDGLDQAIITFVGHGGQVQQWQPPHRAAEKKYGALARGSDGINQPLQVFINHGAQIQAWQPPYPSRKNRGAILNGDDGIEGVYLFVASEIYDWVEFTQIEQVRRPQFQRTALRGESLFAYFSPFKDFGFENQAWQPPRRAAIKGAMLFGGTAPIDVYVPDQGLQTNAYAWLATPLVQPSRLSRARANAIDGESQFAIPENAVPWDGHNHGLTHIKRPQFQRSALRGRSYFSYFTPFVDYGFAVQPWQPPQRTVKKSGAILKGDDGNQGVYLYVPPKSYDWVEFTKVEQIKRPAFQRSALRGESLFAYFSAWQDFGFDKPQPQPPHRGTKSGALTGGNQPLDVLSTTQPLLTNDYAWFATPLFQPQHPRRERAGVLFGGTAALDKYLAITAVAMEFQQDSIQALKQPIANRRFALFGRADFLPSLPVVWGWEIQPYQPPRYKTAGHNAIAGSFGFLPADNAPFVIDQQWQPRIWKTAKLVTGAFDSFQPPPVALLSDVAWHETTPHPASQTQRRGIRGAILYGDGTPPPRLIVFVPWSETTPHPASKVSRNATRGAFLRGDETPLPRIIPFVPWHETPWVYPRKAFLNGFPAPEGWLYDVPPPPPQVALEFNETINVAPMRRPRYERSALRSKASFGYFTPWYDFGFENQAWQPPSAPKPTRGAILRGNDGIEKPLPVALLSDVAWSETPWVYPRKHWRGNWVRGHDGIDATLISLLTSDAPWLETPWVYPKAGTWVRVKAAGFLRGHDGIDDVYVFVPPPVPTPVEDQRGGGDSRFIHGKHLGIDPLDLDAYTKPTEKKKTVVKRKKPEPQAQPQAVVEQTPAPLPPTDLLARPQPTAIPTPALPPRSPIEDIAGQLRDEILGAHDESDAQQILALLQQMQAEAQPPRPQPFREDVVVGQPPAQSPGDVHEAMDMEDAMAALKALNII